MERVTISLEKELLDEFDKYLTRKGYLNRSEAVRDLVRDRLQEDRAADSDSGHSVGCVSYVYDHHQRGLAQRLTTAQHDHHDLVLSSMHVHLDHENCLEVTLLRGPTRDVRAFAEALVAQTGVRHGRVSLTSVDAESAHHHHGSGRRVARRGQSVTVAPHLHLRPKN